VTLILWRPGRKRKGGCRLRQDGEADAAVARRFDSNRRIAVIRASDVRPREAVVRQRVRKMTEAPGWSSSRGMAGSGPGARLRKG
jgi:hypothetical protein